MTTRPSFANLPPTPAEHFRLYLFAAVAHLIDQVARVFDTPEALFDHFPFLAGYRAELVSFGPDSLTGEALDAWWCDAIRAWEARAPGHLPLRALREAADLNHGTLSLFMCLGLVEEDSRFGLLFEAMHGVAGQPRPTLGLLSAWWREDGGRGPARQALRRLRDAGLAQVTNPDAPRLAWAMQPPTILWDVVRGEGHESLAPWARYHPPGGLPSLDELILPESAAKTVALMPGLLSGGEVQALFVRGPRHNGRLTLLGAIARAMGRGVVEITGLERADDERWRWVGPLAAILPAMPVVRLDLPPGETAELPPLSSYRGPLGVTLSKQGGVNAPALDRALTLTLDMPALDARRRHWQQAADGAPPEMAVISERFRLTGGNIRRAARLARAYAALNGREQIVLSDVRQAGRALNRQTLDTLATYVPAEGDWSQLAVGEETARELHHLESRCRHRERLHTTVGPALETNLNSGVRALFSGPSGTGKTLAARLLAAVLEKDLYRMDLSTVINKYIGETEKNLNQVLARAEELDVILLLDEGDALLTRRTGVQSANDRYANLETNYLLQRLESFEGILVVTTNAAELIDTAFQRRMDVVVPFRTPDAAERWAIWQLHLPEGHTVEAALMREVTARCALTGGQIRNAALHAALLALSNGGVVSSAYLETAVQREYRKMGTVCPLRRAAGAREE